MCSPHREPAPGLGGESERIGIVPNVALDYGCLRNASGEYAATHGRRREVLAGVNYSRLDVNEGETQRPAAGYQKTSALRRRRATPQILT
jgi:hypothetical protein